MNTRTKIFRIAAVVLVIFASFAAYMKVTATDKTTDSQLAFHDGMRKLWEDHITWTRLYIISAAEDLPDKEATTQRLLQNQVDIGNAIKPFYGDAAGNQLTALLTDHILIAAQAIDDAKSGNNDAFNEDLNQWYANADEIAAFLHTANPDNWPLHEMEMMMKDHLDLTLQEASHRLSGDYQAEIEDYDLIHEQILEMADMLSAGIIAQFPKMFK
jgi:hypothetical protein